MDLSSINFYIEIAKLICQNRFDATDVVHDSKQILIVSAVVIVTLFFVAVSVIRHCCWMD